MKTIIINLSDRVFNELRTYMIIKCNINDAYGTTDAFIFKLIKAIENDAEEVTFEFKKRRKNDNVPN